MKKIISCLLSMTIAFFAAAQSESAVVSVSLSGPSEIQCGGSAEYTVTFTGTYNAFNKFNVFWDAYDRDFGPDDLLAGGASIDLDGEKGTAAVATRTFTLSCFDCIVKGPQGSSGENTAEVFVIAHDLLVGGNTVESNELSVTCVPEPSTLVCSLFLGVAVLNPLRRRLRMSASKLKTS